MVVLIVTYKAIPIENIKEELADVFNCVEQLSYHFGYDDIQKIRCEKMNRVMKK